MKVKDKNLVRAKHIGVAEFEISQKESYEEQKSIWFKKRLDYDSFIRGFVKGMEYIKRDCSMVEIVEQSSGEKK